MTKARPEIRRRSARLAFRFAQAMLLLLPLASYFALRGLRTSDAAVRHTWAVVEKLQAASFDMLSIESGARGFVLTGRDSYLTAYHSARRREAQDQQAVQVLTIDNPAQTRRLSELGRIGAAKIELLDRLIAVRQNEGSAAGVEATRAGAGEALMSEFQSVIEALQAEERRLLAARSETARERMDHTELVLLLGTTLSWLIIAAASFRVRRDSARRTLAEKALLSSEEKYRTLVQRVRDHAIVLLDADGTVVSWSAGAERMTGSTRAEVIGRNFRDFFPAEAQERGRPRELLNLAAAAGLYEEEGVRRRSDGTPFLVHSSYTALRDADGSLVGFSVVERDLSERTESEAKYRGLLEAAPDAMIVVNQAGDIVLLNLQAEHQFGYRRDELVGTPVKSIIPEGFAERLIADGTRSAAEALAQQIGTGIELVGRRKDDTEFPIEIMLSPLESAEGILVTVAVRNISVRRAAETHLTQMERRYRGLLEAAPDAMVVVNQTGEIVLLNVQAERSFGYHRDELLGQRVTTIIPEGFAERLVADSLRSTAEASIQNIGTGIALTGRRKDGSEFPIEIMLSPLQSAEGILVTAAIRDITARKRAEVELMHKVEELSRSNEELDQFAYIASHDLQEPLRMVASYTQLLARRYQGKLDADADEFIRFAVDGANRMQRLIQDLLKYSRVATTGRALLDAASEVALEQAVQNLGAAIVESGAVVTHDPLPTVMADHMQLTQLFQNLVGNAIKYQNSGAPRVHVSAVRNAEKKWLFSVRDNGLGIDERYFEKIFGMFQRLHKREEFAGTGIGLAICKKIVERHGGSISVESTVGQGSTFRFALSERRAEPTVCEEK